MAFMVEYRARPIPLVWQTAAGHIHDYSDALAYAFWLFAHEEIKRVRLSDGKTLSFTLKKVRQTLG